MSTKIQSIRAREILDSRGDPTVEVRLELSNAQGVRASVPSGASTGVHEALELRDGDRGRYAGKGVLKACHNINTLIAPKLAGKDVRHIEEIDRWMIDRDGTPNKSYLGANAILAVSMAVCRGGALAENVELYQYIKEKFSFSFKKFSLPTPLMNILNGGAHADNDLSLQEMMIVPLSPKLLREKVRVGSEIFHMLGKILKSKKMNTAVGNEGGYAPNVGKSENAIRLVIKAIEETGYQAGKDVSIALDVAASEFYDENKRLYHIATDGWDFNSGEMIDLYDKWVTQYPIISIEDGLSEDDWSGWEQLTAALGESTMLVGDDLFVTNTTRIQRGIESNVANSVLIKMNQIGSITETIEAIRLAQENKYSVVISHRSGETCDNTIADLAVGTGAEYIKTGSLSRSERISKYNRLMEIEEILAGKKKSGGNTFNVC
ncbi:MAG: phosphopyruvate hydratase [Parcubacteria group bacterium Gr01-1014_18]|nr:MAG: phosphopyruvate hydratase [Parcubacteria group bacterium Greene0416_36]TSC81448.1 MAG: phosphopyruvate hydratase [Parcubacteria group bacterium Gr01-1014_18]TSC99046.1 MAG: phosphopyruvate hydratase [Parcubacteria group bacterium Greene1014_20]TSD07273.1 MAG: phosphopyruvate hydratase [Parcubacteria group bacterium Greene0714_2]